MILALLLGLPPAVQAQQHLNIWQTNGELVSYAFAQKPLITYEDETLVLTTTAIKVEYPLSAVRKFTFEDNPNAIGTVHAELKDDAPLRIYSVGGILLKTVPAGPEGSTFYLDNLPKGVYIIKTPTTSHKITKQ
jgi:hypothetical protein